MVADVGAGGGYFTFRLAQAVGPDGRVYAVDPDRDTQAYVRHRAERAGLDNIRTVEPSGSDPLLPEPVDLALVVDALHHLPEPRTDFVARLGERLRRGGRLVVIEPFPRWYLFGHATDPGEIRTMLGRAGHHLTETHGFLERQSFLVFQRGG